MRGFVSLEPDAATLARLIAVQNRLRNVSARQGVSFPERLGATLLAWPFGTSAEIDRAVEAVSALDLSPLALGGLGAIPNEERPAGVGFALKGLETFQRDLFARLAQPLDPDPPGAVSLRIVRIAPPSRKVGVALRGSGLLGAEGGPFVVRALGFWSQTPEGFELRRTIPNRAT